MRRDPPPSTAPPAPRSAAPRALLLALTLLVPVLLLGGAELALRVAGAGGREPLFIAVPDAPGYLQPNPSVVQRFFPNPAQAPRVAIDTTYFRAAKPANAVRLVVQGESSAAGFPYGRFAGVGGLLQQRLQRGLPDRDVEVISTAMSAVTSYVLLDFVDEIIAQHPDAVIIYTGHNEYLGIGGVGSSYASARSPRLARAVLALRHLHLYRALERLLSPARPSDPRAVDDGGTLMSRVAAERAIPLGSALYAQGRAQFESNLDRILARYRAAGIPVFVGTLASNERDQPPFASGTGSAADPPAFDRYRQAQALEAAGRYAEARAEYLAAKDRDELRFRAPEAFNALLRASAARHGATLVDVEGALAAASRHGIIGSELMLEHLHPNLDGYFELAGAFYEPLRARLQAQAVDAPTARRELPVTEIERIAGEMRIALLRHDWPFVPVRQPTTFAAPATAEEQIAQEWFAGRIAWAEAMNRAFALYEQRADGANAARVAINVAEAFVQRSEAQWTAGRVALRNGDPARALPYLRRAVALDPATPDYPLVYAEAEFKTGRIAAAAATLAEMQRRFPGDARARYWAGIVKAELARH